MIDTTVDVLFKIRSTERIAGCGILGYHPRVVGTTGGPAQGAACKRDSSKMNINNTEISCGVWQLDHFIRFEPIEEELKFLVRYVKTRSVSKPAFFIWSHYECVEGVEYSRTGGHQFAELVNGRFGTVTKSERAKNPNTGNMIVLWY